MEERRGEKTIMEMVATESLPVDRLMATDLHPTYPIFHV